MSRDPLEALLKLRQRGQDDARRALAHAVQHETDAMAKAAAVDRAITVEQQAAMDLNAGDGVVEAFAAWLPTARTRAAEAWHAAERAGAEVARTRALLTAAQAAAKTVETLMQQRAAARNTAAARRTQADMDEAGSRQRSELSLE
jgi:flagellar export protein FliJ